MQRPRYKKYSRGMKPSARDFNKRADDLSGCVGSLLQQGFMSSQGLLTRRAITADSGIRLARISQTLRRGDAVADPPVEARDKYKIMLVGLSTAAWNSNFYEYKRGDIVAHNDTFWECTTAHTSNSSKEPNEDSNLWEETTEGEDAWVHGYSGDLLQSAPWFDMGELVQVYKRKSYNEQGQVSSETQRWYICETVFRIEYQETESSERKYSLSWNPEEKRVMAVFG